MSWGFVKQILQYEIGLLRWILFSFWLKIVAMKYHTSCQHQIWWAPVKSIFFQYMHVHESYSHAIET